MMSIESAHPRPVSERADRDAGLPDPLIPLPPPSELGMSSTSSDNSALLNLTSKLSIPQDFGRRDGSITEADTIVALETWRKNAYAVLSDLRAHLQARNELSLDEQAEVVACVAAFDGQGSWILPTTQALALGTTRRVCHHILYSYCCRVSRTINSAKFRSS